MTSQDEDCFWMSGLGRDSWGMQGFRADVPHGKYLFPSSYSVQLWAALSEQSINSSSSPCVAVFAFDFCTGPCKEDLQNRLYFFVLIFFWEICWILNISLSVAEPLKPFVLDVIVHPWQSWAIQNQVKLSGFHCSSYIDSVIR